MKVNFLQICLWSGNLPSIFSPLPLESPPPPPLFPGRNCPQEPNFDVSTGHWMDCNKTSEDVNQPSLFGFLTFSLCGSVESILNSLSLSKNSSSFWSRSLNSSSLPDNQERMEWPQWNLHCLTDTTYNTHLGEGEALKASWIIIHYRETAHLPLPYATINAYFSLRAKC